MQLAFLSHEIFPFSPAPSSPRKDGALGVHRFDPSADGQQVLGMKLPAVPLENFMGIWGYNWMLYIYIYIYTVYMYVYIYMCDFPLAVQERQEL
jgi:hypothetical protein